MGLAIIGAQWARARALGLALLATVAADPALVAFGQVRGNLHIVRLVENELRALARNTGPVAVNFGATESNRARFAAFGIRFEEVAPLPCEHPVQVSASQTR